MSQTSQNRYPSINLKMGGFYLVMELPLVGFVINGATPSSLFNKGQLFQTFQVLGNPSQEGYYNSINPLVVGVPNIFTGLHLGGPTYSHAMNIQGPLA